MIKARSLITAVTVAVVFFLLFQGARLPHFHHAHKPKPNPRAVLNLAAKTIAASVASAKPYDESPHALHESQAGCAPLLQAGCLIAPDVDAAGAHLCRYLPKDRSPPNC